MPPVIPIAAAAPLRSFALQHLGKALRDAGRPAAAIPVLEDALALREATGDTALIASTQQALGRARWLADRRDRTSGVR